MQNMIYRIILIYKKIKKQTPLAPDLSKDNTWYRKTLVELLDLLAAGTIKTIVAERIPLVEAASAHKLLERGGYAGKVVLVTSEYSQDS
jgi:NADPH:quinone reductase-like Zn-dependent oxidoreductase